MYMLYFFIAFAVGIWVFDKFCLWLERKGWLYYRNEKPQKGILGTALQELNAQLLPDKRHVIVAQKQEQKCQKIMSDARD